METEKKETDKRITAFFRVDKQVWDQAEIVLKDVGISRAKYIELLLRSLVKSESMSMKDLMGNLVGNIWESSLLGKKQSGIKKKK
jgi:hypothetical protein